MPVHDFDPPDRFVAGTVGPPGQRVFFLQASGGRRLLSVSCEKEQVAILGERLGDMLDEFAHAPAEEPVLAQAEDNAPLDTPIEEEFRVVTLSLGWDPDREVVIIECHNRDVSGEDAGDAPEDEDPGIAAVREIAEEPEEPEEPEVPSSLRVVIPPGQARDFARRCRALVAGGRPPCPFCGGPLDPRGHVCPRSNGYKR